MSNSSSRLQDVFFWGFKSVENQDLAPTGVPGPTGSSFRFGMFHLRRWSNASFDAANAEENLFAWFCLRSFVDTKSNKIKSHLRQFQGNHRLQQNQNFQKQTQSNTKRDPTWCNINQDISYIIWMNMRYWDTFNLKTGSRGTYASFLPSTGLPSGTCVCPKSTS